MHVLEQTLSSWSLDNFSCMSTIYDCKQVTRFNPYRTKSAYGIPSLRKIVIKYKLEEHFGIDVQMKVIDLEFFILFIQLDLPMLS
jgi:hypothetical protein